MKPDAASLKSIRLLDQVRERIRYLHYSLSTEKVYPYLVKSNVRWQAPHRGGMRALIEEESARGLALLGGTLPDVQTVPRWDSSAPAA